MQLEFHDITFNKNEFVYSIHWWCHPLQQFLALPSVNVVVTDLLYVPVLPKLLNFVHKLQSLLAGTWFLETILKNPSSFQQDWGLVTLGVFSTNIIYEIWIEGWYICMFRWLSCWSRCQAGKQVFINGMNPFSIFPYFIQGHMNWSDQSGHGLTSFGSSILKSSYNELKGSIHIQSSFL